MTKYVKTEVDIGKGLKLYVDGNSKITAGNGTYDDPKPNALSLPHISTCPGSTEQCREACYVYGLQQNAPEVYKEYCKNEMVIHRILISNKTMNISAQLFGDWITENCADGFRWHVSGDVMSDRHAIWISEVCKASPKIRHWIYTRSLELIQFLYAPNLAVNLSADADNYDKAISIWEDVEGIRICYMTRDGSVPELPAGSVIFPDYSLRGREMDRPTDHWWWKQITTEQKRMVCPPDFFGQSERHRCGPCKKCLHPASYKDNQKAEEVDYERRAV